MNNQQPKKFFASELLKPYNFGKPIEVTKIYKYLNSYGADRLTWYKKVSVLKHIAIVALFSAQIAKKAKENRTKVDIHKTWIMGWLHDVGRVPWETIFEQGHTEIIKKYGHHGYLGYEFLTRSKVPMEIAITAMTHTAGGISAKEAQEINQKVFGRKVFPVRGWLASTLEEKIVVVADKIPGWNNTVMAPYRKYQKGEKKGSKIYGEAPNQKLPWKRFWSCKKEVDKACGIDTTTLFNKEILSGKPEAYAKLPSVSKIIKMKF